MKSLSIPYPFKCFLLFLFLFILSYSNAIHESFMLDDYINLLGEENLSSVSFIDLFLKDFKGYYRPITFCLMKIVLAVFDKNPLYYHLYNGVIFFIICYFFYFLINRITGDSQISLLTGLLYTVHPINQFFVNYKTASNLSVNILCLQLSAWFFLKYYDEASKRFYILSLLFYGIALLAHEMNLILPLLLMAAVFFLRKFSLKDLHLFIPFAVIAVLYFYLRSQILTAIPLSIGYEGLTFAAYGSTLIKLIFWYLSKLLLPLNIIFIWDERVGGDAQSFIYAIAFMAFLFSAIAFAIKSKDKITVFGLTFFVAGLLPILFASFIFSSRFKTAMIEPHWFGFSSIGFFLVAAHVLLRFKAKSRRVWIFTVVAILISLAFTTRQHNTLWVDEKTYCRYWLNQNALNGTAWNCLARNYIQENDRGLKSLYYKTCQEPSYLGWAYHALNYGDKALQYHLLALKMDKSCPETYYGLSLMFEQNNKHNIAQKILKKAQRIDSRFLPLYDVLSGVFKGRHGKEAGVEVIEMYKIIKRQANEDIFK